MDGATGQYTDCVLYMLKVVWTLSSVQFRMVSVSVPRNGRNVGLNVHSNNRGLIRFIRDGVVVVVVVGIGYLCAMLVPSAPTRKIKQDTTTGTKDSL